MIGVASAIMLFSFELLSEDFRDERQPSTQVRRFDGGISKPEPVQFVAEIKAARSGSEQHPGFPKSLEERVRVLPRAAVDGQACRRPTERLRDGKRPVRLSGPVNQNVSMVADEFASVESLGVLQHGRAERDGKAVESQRQILLESPEAADTFTGCRDPAGAKSRQSVHLRQAADRHDVTAK